jgi:hypothetical protein
MKNKLFGTTPILGLALLAGPVFIFAQDQTTPAPAPQTDQQQHSGWRRADSPPPTPAPMQSQTGMSSSTPDPGAVPVDSGSPQGPPPSAQQPYDQQSAQQPYSQPQPGPQAPPNAPSDPRDQYGAPISGGGQAPPPQYPPNGQYPPNPQYPANGQYPPNPQYPANGQYPNSQYPPNGPRYPSGGQYPPQYQGAPQYQGGMNRPAPRGPIPAQLTLKPGTYVTVRINQPLSSDHNQQGDPFTATLVRPLVVDGVVVAQIGETVGGHVVEAQKAGRVSGVSRLAVQLTDLTLVDGDSVPIHSQLINRTGPTSVGRDVAGVAGTTALGAAVGATADWGRGAAIGAGAGAAVGILGVLLTRGQPTIIYPEQMLTFRVEQPVTIATDRAPQAFRYVEPEDYGQGLQASGPGGPRSGCGPYGCPPPSMYAAPYGPSPYYYGPGYYPYYGPSFGFFYGPRFYARGGYFYGRGRR